MTQKWNAKQYIDHASFVAEHGTPVLQLLAPKQGENILDLGCGDGALTAQISKSGAIVHGVDFSESMIHKAKDRGLSAEVMSGEALNFSGDYDAVFSNAALHWMTNPDAVLQGVHKALKPDGRFVAEFGGYGNVNTLVCAMKQVFGNHPEFGDFKSPWYFPDAEEYKKKLENHGFVVDYIELIPRPTALISGVQEWLKLFSNGITKDLDLAQTEVFLAEVTELVGPALLIDNQWMADYVRLRFSAFKQV